MGAPNDWHALRHFGGEDGPDYRCPRCSQGVGRRSDHVVAWPSSDQDRRRHWHTECWRAAVREGIERYRWS